MITISNAAFGLIIAEGQLENAIREERRWLLREQEAQAHRLNARVQVLKWQRAMEDLKEAVCKYPVYHRRHNDSFEERAHMQGVAI